MNIIMIKIYFSTFLTNIFSFYARFEPVNQNSLWTPDSDLFPIQMKSYLVFLLSLTNIFDFFRWLDTGACRFKADRQFFWNRADEYSRLSNKLDGWNKRDGRKILQNLGPKCIPHQQISNLSVFLDISSYI